MADEPESTVCSNCKKMISTANFTMHEMHCRRHIILCEHCNDPVPRMDMDIHYAELHAKVACKQCGEGVEKPSLQKHMENLCSRKLARCSYCELELPMNELAGHHDYCGTRTEACPLCQQFIMKKDQLQHDDSNCQFPIPKPTNNGFTRDRPRNEQQPETDFEFVDGYVNPFAMDEISRIMDDMREAKTLNSRVEIPGFGQRHRGGRHGGFPPSQSYTNNNTALLQKSTTNRRSEVNKQRQRVTEADVPEDIELDSDRELALRLQEEDDLELDILIRQIEKKSPTEKPTTPHSPISYNTFPDDGDLIPCEFCGEHYPVEILVQHQSSCDPLSTGQWSQETSWERNNEAPVGWSRGGVSIPVIDNLDSAHHAQDQEIPIQWESDSPPQDNFLDGDGEIILPCEFCSDQFPYELLIQHQSGCDLNPTMTQRIQTPSTDSNPRSQGRNILTRSTRHHSNGPLTRTYQRQADQRQADPTPVDSDSEDEIIDYSQSGISGEGVQPPASWEDSNSRPSASWEDSPSRPSASREDNPSRPSASWEDNPSRTSASWEDNPSRSVASKYGAPASQFDDYITRGGRRRQDVPSNVEKNVAPQRRGSDTRATLDRLLQETDTDHNLLSAVGNRRKKSAKNIDNNMKKRAAGASSKKNLGPSTSTSARDVMRELNRPQNSQSGQRSTKRNNSRSQLEDSPPFNIQPVGQGHSRLRANHVFDPEVRRSSRRHQPSNQQNDPGYFDDDDNNV